MAGVDHHPQYPPPCNSWQDEARKICLADAIASTTNRIMLRLAFETAPGWCQGPCTLWVNLAISPSVREPVAFARWWYDPNHRLTLSSVTADTVRSYTMT